MKTFRWSSLPSTLLCNRNADMSPQFLLTWEATSVFDRHCLIIIGSCWTQRNICMLVSARRCITSRANCSKSVSCIRVSHRACIAAIRCCIYGHCSRRIFVSIGPASDWTAQCLNQTCCFVGHRNCVILIRSEIISWVPLVLSLPERPQMSLARHSWKDYSIASKLSNVLLLPFHEWPKIVCSLETVSFKTHTILAFGLTNYVATAKAVAKKVEGRKHTPSKSDPETAHAQHLGPWTPSLLKETFRAKVSASGQFL